LDGFRSQIRHFTCDLSRPEEVEALAGRVRTEWGAPDILVNNAGVQYNHDWAETPATDRARWAQTELSLNTLAPTLLTALFLDDLGAADPGVVVNVTSLLGLSPKRSAPVYSASKAALRSFTQALRWQLADHGSVRVVEVIPPMVDTAMTSGRGAKKMQPADAAERIVLGLERDELEIRLGVARLVHLLSRVAPPLATAILKGS
jgi:short-subunit dehydrogenase involved in D-alanine esterification of teichoic acids